MKHLRLLLILSLIISCLFAFASCDDTEVLSAPDDIKIEQTTLTLQWDAVAGARLYTISIVKEGEEPREAIASKTYYSLTGLAEGQYTIAIKANGKDGISRDSDWSEEISFVREREPGMAFTLINGNTAYEVAGKGTATGDIVIPDTYRGLPVTSIGKKAFFNKSDVTSVVIGKNVTSIGDYAFANCSYVTSISIPDGITYIGESAFASCRLMEGSIVIPGGIKTVSKNAFAYCGNLRSVTFSEGIRTIEASAFTDCAKLDSLSFPSSLEYVGTLAFARCSGVSSIEFQSGVCELDDYSFSELPLLTGVTIPDTVERLGEGTFYRCSGLVDVSLGTGIVEIALGAFDETKLWSADPASNDVYVDGWFLGCKDNTVNILNIKQDTVGIASFALYGNSGLSTLVIPDSVKIVGEGAFGKMAINTAILGGGVHTLGMQAFAACQSLTTVILGSFDDKTATIKYSSLEHIGDYAFRECTSLDTIEMPSTLKTVGSYAFRDSGLYKNANGVVYADNWAVDYNEKIGASVTLKDGTVGVANYAFYNCTQLNSISMPSSVKTVGRAAFYDCSALSEVELPITLTRIEEYTFYRCKSLKLFQLPALLTYIGRSAFYKCGSSAAMMLDDTGDDVLVIPADVTYIGDYAFYSCGYSEKAALDEEQYVNTYGIDRIVFGNSVEYIGANAFYGFVSLKGIELGGTKVIGEKAFYKCEFLETVDFGSALKTIGTKAFYKCIALNKISLPSTVTEVGSYAFYKCESLAEVELGNVESIGAFAFYGDYMLRQLVLPESVSFIGKQAFRNCTALTSIILSSAVDVIEQHAFYGCSSLTIYAGFDEVPENWHKYWNSSYRPVVYGAVFSEDASYLLYIERGTISNLNSTNSLSDPVRVGYTFVGWGNSSTATVPVYTSANLSEAEDGRKLYAIWAEE